MNLQALVRQWDEDPAVDDTEPESSLTAPPPDPRQSYAAVLERIRALQRCGFGDYEGSVPVLVEHRLPRWLEQLSPDEQRIALIAASRILFVTRPMLRALQRHVYENQIRRVLLDDAIAEYSLPPFRYDLAKAKLPEMVQRSVFVPLSDSADLNSFIHINRDLDRPASRRLIGPGMHTLVQPRKLIEANPAHLPLAEQNLRVLQSSLRDKTHLFILEDFAGSGQTAATDIRRVVGDFPQFHRIAFCPYVCTQDAKEAVEQIPDPHQNARPRIAFLEALVLPREAKAFRGDCFMWQDYELPLSGARLSGLLQEFCERYWKSHHRNENAPYEGSNEPIRIHPGGYRDTQLLVVLYTNCPNNTLPILWSAADGSPQPWHPLFGRYSRY